MTLKETHYNGITLKGDAVMLSKYGDIYNCIDNAYHPNTGSKADGYPEIERCIDWLLGNNLFAVKGAIVEWLKCRVALVIDEDFEEVIHDVMYDDFYQISDETRKLISEIYNDFIENEDELNQYIGKDELIPAEKIANYINETFLRIRCGGKLNPDGSNSIYFRISSHGYDWHRNIVDFLWEVFGDIKSMPEKIVICHDAETNPPEIILFEGTPIELFEDFDQKKFESFKKDMKVILESKINNDRKAFRLNSAYYLNNIENPEKYLSFE